ncbi:DUF2442 domain-containing protein [Endozoicomonas sp. YOMI1]|uniref:DUF2442 domain-containing protein n=1 Tax=Endozoicomonas sp. YOMI1 TaxID=2828739 RepID=UPI002148F6E0|nr:DUF2442 domain-containing protein [Endozoicomonas sp. YOMI1]
MNSSNIEPRPLAQNIQFTDSELIVTLLDGRVIHIPIDWFPTLANATEKQRANWKLLGEGDGIHWPELDEDLSVAGLLKGNH